MDWTGVQVTLWQLSREKSLIAKRPEMKGSSGHTSKANFGSAFVSSNPPTPASQCGLSYAISRCVRTIAVEGIEINLPAVTAILLGFIVW